MGTRSLTVFQDEDNNEIVVMYRQLDGYPEGHGAELAEFLAGSILVNGIALGRDESAIHNGMGCLAASVVAYFKTGVGGFYLYPAGTRNCGEEYVYTVSGTVGSEPRVAVTDAYDGDISFGGTATEFLAWCRAQG